MTMLSDSLTSGLSQTPKIAMMVASHCCRSANALGNCSLSTTFPVMLSWISQVDTVTPEEPEYAG